MFNLNSDGQQFHQYQQNEQPPFTSNHLTQKKWISRNKTYQNLNLVVFALVVSGLFDKDLSLKIFSIEIDSIPLD